MASYTRAELERQKESLTAKLKEVTDRLEKFDETIYKGKMAKAIKLLGECLDYFNYPTVPLECPDCERGIEVDLDDVISGLEILYREEFKYD